MFETFYSMTDTPFTREMPPQELYRSDLLDDIIDRLTYAAQRQLFAVVTGDCGTGKTTAIRQFSAALDVSAYKLLYLSDSKLTPRHFYKGMLEQLGCESVGTILRLRYNYTCIFGRHYSKLPRYSSWSMSVK